MQWVQDSSRKNVDNLKNIRRNVTRHCRNKKKEYLQFKIEEHETNNKLKNTRKLYRCISDYKKIYHPRTNKVKVEKVEFFTDSHSILSRWWNRFSQLLNIHGVKLMIQLGGRSCIIFSLSLVSARKW
jgi:hypothetical protein